VRETFKYDGTVGISQIQLESGDESSEFVIGDSNLVLNECQRSYEVGSNERTLINDGLRRCYGLTDTVSFKSTKYREPQVCLHDVDYQGTHHPQNLRILNKSSRKFTTVADIEKNHNGYGSYTSGAKYDWVADAEMPISMSNRTYIEY